MSTRFDGANDNIVTSIGTINTPVTSTRTHVVLLKKNLDTAWQSVMGLHDASNLVTSAVEIDNTNKASFSTHAANKSGVSTITAADGWTILASTKSHSSTTTVPRFHIYKLGVGSWVHEDATASVADPTSVAAKMIFGEWEGVDDLNAWIAVAAVWNAALSDTQIAELSVHLKTSDWLNCSAGAPAALWEFNVSSLTDLTGNGANETGRTGATLDAANEPPGWTYDGTGAAPPASGAGEYGWGTYGAGNYGPTFGSSGVAVPASEAFAFTEGSSLVQIAVPTTDSIVVTDSVSGVAADLQRSDSDVLSGVSNVSAAAAATDALALTEQPSSTTQQQAVAASDGEALSETSQMQSQSSLAAVDSWAVAEASSAAVSTGASDAWAAAEGTSSIGLSGPSDSGVESDASSLQTQSSLSVVDAWITGEASGVASALTTADGFAGVDLVSILLADMSRTDGNALIDQPASLADVLNAVDSFGANEASSLANALSTGDSASVLDTSSLFVGLSLSASDAAALSEISTVAADLVATETVSSGEFSALVATLAAQENFSLNELADTAQLALMTAADSSSMTDVATLVATLERIDSNALTEAAVSITAALFATLDLSNVTEASDLASTIVPGSTYIHSLPPMRGVVSDEDLAGAVAEGIAAGNPAIAAAFGEVVDYVATAIVAAAAATGLPHDAVASGETQHTASGSATYTAGGVVFDAATDADDSYQAHGIEPVNIAGGAVAERGASGSLTDDVYTGSVVSDATSGEVDDETASGVQV